MRALVARVNKADVFVGEDLYASIPKGIALFVNIEKNDDDSVLEEMAEKVMNLRIFEGENEKLNYSIKDKNYAVLCIPNFTLLASVKKGRRPSFEEAASKENACLLFNNFFILLTARSTNVRKAAFGEHMNINLTCDGPVNIIIDIKKQAITHKT
jgi:D-tyrosyl-tRNA(Tyr) deacylase